MTDKATEDLDAADALDGAELVHGVQGGNSRKITVDQLMDLVAARYKLPVLTPPVASDFATVINSPTVTEGERSTYVTGATNALTLRARLRSLPGGNFSVRAKVRSLTIADFNQAGIIFRDTAGKYCVYGQIYVSGNFIECSNFSNATTFASANSGLDLNQNPPPEWLRCDFNASTNDLTNFVSFDGENWLETGTNSYLGTCDAVGFGIVSRNTTSACRAWFEHFEII